MATKKSAKTESHTVNGEELMQKIKDLIKAGNVRRVLIKNDKGEILARIPVNIGIVGAVIAPFLAFLGVAGAMVGLYTVEIERKEK